MNPDLEKRIAALASDRESGASEILDEALAILREALGNPADLLATARAMVRAQPTMAPIWNAALVALASQKEVERFERFAQRVARAPAALARFAIECFAPDAQSAQDARSEDRAHGEHDTMRLATISYSRTVLRVLEALSRVRPLHIACSESRPALEGRRLATRLAALDVRVTFFSDAAITQALGAVDAVLLGADAVTPEYFLNKSGTRMLAAVASQHGVPVYVLASRDKFVSHEVAARLHPREGAASELWPDPPPGVTVRNPYFESTPLDLITSVITDVGIIGTAAVPDVCESTARDSSAEILGLLQVTDER